MNTWIIDPAHTEIGFKIKHLVISTVRGMFKTYEGSIAAVDDTFNDATITFSADVASITTHNEMRDGHLLSADFFDVEKFPKLTFQSTKVVRSGNVLNITGDLTIKDVTKSVELTATVHGTTVGPDGKPVAVFDLTGTIERADFGLTWNTAIETGGFAVGDTVTFDMSIETKQA